MEKLTLAQLIDIVKEHNADHNIRQQYQDNAPLICVVVFKNDSWPTRNEDYSLESRSYEFRSDEKYFLPSMGGCSLFANSLDGTDRNVRLERYLFQWKVDYCYVR
jgi:hypothetical protein